MSNLKEEDNGPESGVRPGTELVKAEEGDL